MASKPVAVARRPYMRTDKYPSLVGEGDMCRMLQHGGDLRPCCEVSLEMRNRHIDQIERKYGGGPIETQQAAQIIQYNFRQYTLSKKFERLRSTQDELREQRLNMMDMSSDRDSVWSDVAVTAFPISPHVPISISVDHPRHAHQEMNDTSTNSTPSPDGYPPFDSNDSNDDSLSYARNQSNSDSHLINIIDSHLVDLHVQHNRSDNVSGKARKRQYRIGLNLFNKKPEHGIKYLMEQRFLANSARAVAEFLIHRKGLSKQMIGEYLGNLQSPFNQDVLVWVIRELDLNAIEIDQALRKLISLFRLPGEAQKIERVIEVFSQWYCLCNPNFVKQFNSVDTLFLIAFAVIMLNTDLHNPNIKPASKMKLEAFIKNLKGIDKGRDIPVDMLTNIYNRISNRELKTSADHVSQVRKVEETLIGKIPLLAVPQRRLVCYCRLYEVSDPNKKEKVGLHQREIFLFNDVLVITKIFAKKRDVITYTFRQSIILSEVNVQVFNNEHYHYGIKLISTQTHRPIIYFNARNNHDRDKFVDDLIDSITELQEMRIVLSEPKRRTNIQRSRMSKDSGVADLDFGACAPNEQSYIHRWPPRDCNDHSRSTSLTELDKGLRKSQSNRSVDSCVTKKAYHV